MICVILKNCINLCRNLLLSVSFIITRVVSKAICGNFIYSRKIIYKKKEIMKVTTVNIFDQITPFGRRYYSAILNCPIMTN